MKKQIELEKKVEEIEKKIKEIEEYSEFLEFNKKNGSLGIEIKIEKEYINTEITSCCLNLKFAGYNKIIEKKSEKFYIINDHIPYLIARKENISGLDFILIEITTNNHDVKIEKIFVFNIVDEKLNEIPHVLYFNYKNTSLETKKRKENKGR